MSSAKHRFHNKVNVLNDIMNIFSILICIVEHVMQSFSIRYLAHALCF